MTLYELEVTKSTTFYVEADDLETAKEAGAELGADVLSDEGELEIGYPYEVGARVRDSILRTYDVWVGGSNGDWVPGRDLL